MPVQLLLVLCTHSSAWRLQRQLCQRHRRPRPFWLLLRRPEHCCPLLPAAAPACAAGDEVDEAAVSNVVLGQFEKVQRSKSKWKIVLKVRGGAAAAPWVALGCSLRAQFHCGGTKQGAVHSAGAAGQAPSEPHSAPLAPAAAGLPADAQRAGLPGAQNEWGNGLPVTPAACLAAISR